MKLLLGHPTGNQFFRHLAATIARRGHLGRVASCLNFTGPLGVLLSQLAPKMRVELERRAFRESWASNIYTRPWREAGRLAAQRLKWSFAVKPGGFLSVDTVYRDFDRWLARHLSSWQQEVGLSGVYAYEDGALATFTAAKALGMRCVYDLPIAYWETGRRLMTEEAARLPTWAPTLGGGIGDSAAKLDRKIRELELADLVVCPSQFVVDSLPNWTRAKQVVLAPFGSPGTGGAGGSGEDGERKTDDGGPRANRKLRVLFAGSMGQRKGLGDLFAAVKLLKRTDIELVVMGALLAPMQFYRGQLNEFIYESTRPHHQVLALMRSCDVLCLPSIVEGRALVMQEAMSQGLPLIITSNTGGADLIDEGRTGFLVPIRDPQCIAEKIAWLADRRETVIEMAFAAKAKADSYTWANYGNTIITAIEDATSLRGRHSL